ncbi:metallophosphoesterase [Sandaracinus amylolyticus]|uniref:Putative serine/threonine phosphatase n=1 Tax=Sandaracinus amylolyticus TaxID=927083 RepID=A0A0F6YGH4_9BACT|nr:metallophosphoesterase [Sandaracinus amylolyticus]AKF03682.1 putative serine/threonine phosphatase [Sandaracinus amylolyticus]
MRALLLVVALVLVGCGETSAPAPSRSRAPSKRAVEAPRVEVPPLPPSTYPAPPRLVAIGDVHGDVDALRSALRAAGAIDDADRWSGGALWIVQVGDLLDRGDTEDEVLALVSRLEREADAAGGRFVALHGNHELMNVQGDFRYVTPDGLDDFARYASEAPPGAARSRIPARMLGRAVAFAPGGPIARALAARNTIAIVGDTVFVHGGLAPSQLERGVDAINRDVRAFLLGEAPLPRALAGEESPVWHRAFALGDDAETCATLARTLEGLGVARMVIGHTVQDEGIGSACEGRVWRIDVGLSRHYGGPIEVLEIEGDTIEVLRGTR